MREPTASKHAVAAEKRTDATGAATTRSTPHRRAKQDRGLETRDRLIEAALDVFGKRGFEGASTREIAKAAGVNLAAIVYHFGSKDALYLAVAEHVVAGLRARVGPAIALMQSQVDQIDPATARVMVAQLLGTMVDVVVGNPEAERWARFMIREQLDPTAAFEIIYGFMGEAHGLLAKVVATAVGGDPDSANAKIRAFTVIGQGLVFRICQTMVLRRLGRDALGPTEREEIKKVLRENIAAILSGETNAA